jgi:phosphate starvation-inducible protein PhoH and related proteins
VADPSRTTDHPDAGDHHAEPLQDEGGGATDREGRPLEAAGGAPSTSVKVLVPGEHSMVSLLGAQDELLRLIERSFETTIHVRGNEIAISGHGDEVETVAQLFEELVILLQRGHTIDRSLIRQTIRMVKSDDEARPSVVLSDALLTHRGRTIRPKSLGQKQYLDAIRENTVTFGIGPAGTGKTYLAMGAAVQALRDKQVNRLILTRPAVEAGERLGFLPGTLHEKIDPYLKPLWDALHDMMEADELAAHVERGTIEVAPLAYMRGRAQPVDTPVLTPEGFRPIGELQVGDLVVGSDGRPTPVLGVHPQGRKPVFRLTTQDGASTRCCEEHLWQVTTPYDRRIGREGRVVETRYMRGRLRTAHYRRFELPLVGPVELPHRDVPMDPYALGLLLGDGCMTTSTTPSFATSDEELAQELDRALDGVEVRHKDGYDYVLANPEGGRGIRVVNPVTAVLRELDLAGTRSDTKFVPELYLHNDVEVRLALLQGLLDSDGGPVRQRERTCRIQYTTCSDRLRDDVVALVRSLGGVVYTRTRRAEGRRPGRANGRDVPHRSDAHILDIRLPAGIEPFRLARKREIAEEHGHGRPMRFVDAIEPDGEAETVCIQVAAADSLYVTEDFLVTHNTLNSAFIVADEAQNTTAEQMKMFLTRIGFGSKAVVTGDISQVDLPSGKRSGLRVVREILEGIEGVAFCTLSSGDVVRHHIVQRIVEAYEAFEEERDEGAQGDGR